MTKETWTAEKMDHARHTRVPGLNLMTLGCVGISIKPQQNLSIPRPRANLEGRVITPEDADYDARR